MSAPLTAETVATEPDATEPDTTEPDATEPDTTEPGATEPGATETGANETGATGTASASWHATACILCESNCGIEVRLGATPDVHGRRTRFERIRGDKAHPGSKGYTCEKALRLDHYQNGTERLTSPLRRRADGTYEEIDWDTAIAEVAERFARIRDDHGGASIFYYGGGGQGNHLGGAHSGATLRALGGKYRASALSQEKTGEFWVNGQVLGSVVRADFEHAEVALFVGKNPWQSHGFAHARTTLKEIAADPARSMIVIDPRRTETAELAEFHLRVRPGTDAWCLAAMGGVLVQEGLLDATFISAHIVDSEPTIAALRNVLVDDFCRIAGVDEELVRAATRRLAGASSVSVFEDLGIQQAPFSTLNSWLEKLLWLLTGNFAKPGTAYVPSALIALARAGSGAGTGTGNFPVTPVVGARIISGLVPGNVIPDEILTDHPARYRAMLVETANPAHSLADSPRMREALGALELLVVIDITMTETARLAHYVLPAPSQYEKAEATFFNFEFPRNVFHLRRPLIAPLPGTLPEPEIHTRLAKALGVVSEDDLVPLRAAAAQGRAAFATAFLNATVANPKLAEMAPIVLYDTLGRSLPDGLGSAALLWGAAQRCAMSFPKSVARAGFGDGPEAGDQLFQAILDSPSGVVFTVDEWDDVWARVKTPDGKIHLTIPSLLSELDALHTYDPDQYRSAEFPLVLSAGERRSFTANTIFRDPTWRKKDAGGALRISPADAASFGITSDGMARVSTARGSVVASVEITDMMQPGHISLPNGLGLDSTVNGNVVVTGAAPNELTTTAHRDPIAGTPFHKHVPARVEAFVSA